MNANAGIERANKARAELHETLALLSKRLDYPTRVDNALKRTKSNLARQARRNPGVFIAGIVGTGLVVGAAVAGVTYVITRNIQKAKH